jgi:PKD repeat protein
LLAAAVLGAAGCDKLPLLAPSGTVITLFAGSTTVGVNGQVEITATLIEQGTTTTPSTGNGQQTGQTGSAGAGTPVHNGTLVTFTTSLGRVEPPEARTHNGRVTVRLVGQGQSGTAKVFAFSGGAKSAELEILVGTAAAGRVIVSANPQTLPSTGGSAEISARVEDAGGGTLAGVPVTFSTDAGTVSPQSAVSDSSGVARATLSTTRNATVTATAGAQTATVAVVVNGRVGVSITPPVAAVNVGQPAIFQVAVTVPQNTTVADVRVDFGDGSTRSLGPITAATSVSHIYDSHGVYTVRATATDSNGQATSGETEVVVAPTSVSLTASISGRTATFTATVSPATLAVQHFIWDFGDGNVRTTPGPVTSQTYGAPGTYTVNLTMVPVSGPPRSTQTSIVIP